MGWLCTFTQTWFGVTNILCSYYWKHFDIFPVVFWIFKSKKLLAHAQHAPVSGWHPRHSGGACDITRWPNLTFQLLPACAIVFSSTWFGVTNILCSYYWEHFDIFPVVFWIFKSKKLLAHAQHAPVSGWHPRHSGGACDVTRRPNLTFQLLPACAIVFSSTWFGVWWCVVVGWSLVVVCFFFLLFSLLTGQVHHYPLCF